MALTLSAAASESVSCDAPPPPPLGRARGALPARDMPPARRGSLTVAAPPPAGLRLKARSGCRLVPPDRPAGGNRLVAAAPPPALRSFARFAAITRRSSNSRAPARLLLVPGGGGGSAPTGSSDCVSVSCCIFLRVASRCCSASASADGGSDTDPSGTDVSAGASVLAGMVHPSRRSGREGHGTLTAGAAKNRQIPSTLIYAFTQLYIYMSRPDAF